MPAGGHIATAQVGHHRDAGALGQQGRIEQLQGVTHAVMRPRLVAHRLAMGPDGGDGVRRQSCGLQQLLHHLGIQQCHGIARQSGAVQFVLALAAVQAQQLIAHVGGHGAAGVGQDLQRPVLGELHHHPIHPVQGGARHQADQQSRGRAGSQKHVLEGSTSLQRGSCAGR